ncbi:hypothetical protein AMELA_G00157880, partial [Ameiurus melas]
QSSSGCKHGNYAACLVAYTGLIGSPITPNYAENTTSNVSPWCTCSASGSQRQQCTQFLDYFTNNICLNNALLMFGNGMDQSPTASQTDRRISVTDRDTRNSSSGFVSMDTEENIASPTISTQDTERGRLWGDSTIPFNTHRNSSQVSTRECLPIIICLLLTLLLSYDQ